MYSMGHGAKESSDQASSSDNDRHDSSCASVWGAAATTLLAGAGGAAFAAIGKPVLRHTIGHLRLRTSHGEEEWCQLFVGLGQQV